MATKPAPPALKPRDFTIASCIARDWSDTKIAKHFKMSPQTIARTRKSPLMILEVQRLKNRQTERASDNYVDQVMADGADNVAFLQKVRNGKLPEFDEMSAVDRIKARMSAALPLFDRQAPKRAEADNAPGVTVVFQKSEQLVMAESLRDIGVRIPQLDDVIAEYKQAEDEAAASDA